MNGFKPAEIKARNGKKANSKVVNSREIGPSDSMFKLKNKDEEISGDASGGQNSRQDIAKHFLLLENLREIAEGAESHHSGAYGKTCDFKLNGVRLRDENAAINNII